MMDKPPTRRAKPLPAFVEPCRLTLHRRSLPIQHAGVKNKPGVAFRVTALEFFQDTPMQRFAVHPGHSTNDLTISPARHCLCGSISARHAANCAFPAFVQTTTPGRGHRMLSTYLFTLLRQFEASRSAFNLPILFAALAACSIDVG